MDKIVLNLWRIYDGPREDEDGTYWLHSRVTSDDEAEPFDVELAFPDLDSAYELMLRFEVATEPTMKLIVGENYRCEMH
jgi:hypothetical protein